MSSKYRKNSTPIEQAKNTEFSPADACRKGKFEEMRPGNSGTKSILGNLGVTPGLPDTKSSLEALRVMPEVLGTKSILGNLGATPQLPDAKRSLEAMLVIPEVLDTKSILGNLGVTPGLPDTKSSLKALRVMPEVLDTKSILGNLGLTPGLPDTKSSLKALRVMPETPGAKSTLEGLRITSELFDVAGIVGGMTAAPNESTSGAEPGGMEADYDLGPIPRSPTSSEQLRLRAEIELCLDLAPVPQPIESSVPSALANPQYWMAFCEVERRLRILVRDQLTSLVGSHWVKRRVPPDVREQWHERQDEDRTEGRPVHDLVEYAHFMDLLKIILRKDNWKDVFQTIFRHQDEIEVTFRHLNLVRKALAHGRPLSQMDVLTLTTETSRILDRLRARALH